jgi:hypothetical protein
MTEQSQRTILSWTMPMGMCVTHTLIEQCGNGRCPLQAFRLHKS